MTNGIVVQLAKNFITELLIERECLEVESITMHMDATAIGRLAFGREHEALSQATTPERFGNPKLFYKQPIPVSETEQATNNFAVVTR